MRVVAVVLLSASALIAQSAQAEGVVGEQLRRPLDEVLGAADRGMSSPQGQPKALGQSQPVPRPAGTLIAQTLRPRVPARAAGDADWVGVAAQLAPEITSQVIREGITSVTAGLVSEVIIALGARIPEEIARKILLSPSKLFGWAARITNREVMKDLASVDPIGLAVGVVVEMLVAGVRDTCPCPGTALNNYYSIEGLVWSLRQSAVGYAFTRAGLHGAIAAESIITAVTMTEALTEGIRLRSDRQEEAESKILTNIMQRVRDFANEIKTETDPQRKAEKLQALDDYLRREQTRLAGKAAQLDAWRQKLLASLAKINGLREARAARAQGARLLYAMRKGDKWGFVDRDGRQIVPFQFERISSLEDRVREILSIQHTENDFFVGTLLAVRYRGRWGFIDQDGAWVIPPQFEAVGDCLVSGDPIKVDCFAYGPAPVRQNGRWGYVDRSGRLIVPPQFDWASGFSDRGIATVELGARYGVIDAVGRYVLEPRFSRINVFEAGVIDAQDESGRLALFDQTGKWIADQPAWRIGGVPREGLRSLTLADGRTGVIELASGKTVVPFQFRGVGEFGEGLAFAYSDTRRGYIDRFGKFVFTGPFEQGGRFREGLAEIRVRGKFGFVDRAGKIVVEPRFDGVREFRDGVAWVRVGTKQGYISLTASVKTWHYGEHLNLWMRCCHADEPI